MINAIIRLRRDNDFNYNKIKDSFIPANGEICLVDTARAGLRAVCGDGKTAFGQLDFIDNLIQKGYYFEDKFFEDELHTKELKNSIISIYLEKNTNTLYHHNGTTYVPIDYKIPTANAIVPGIVKLYNEKGQNIDGTMTQKAITDELNSKVELSLYEDEEMIIFSL